MNIYSNFYYPFLKENFNVKPMPQWQVGQHGVFIVKFSELVMLKETIGNFFENNNISKLLIVNDWSPLYIQDNAKTLYQVCIDFKINHDQLYFIMLDKAQRPLLLKELERYNVTKINVEARNHLMIDINPIYDFSIQPLKKFSLCIRSYRPWRLAFFVKLIENDLLNNFLYTFSNIEPYWPVIEEREHSKYKLKLEKCVVNSDSREQINRWIDNMPYLLGSDINEVYNEDIFKTIKKSYINVVLETHIDEQMVFITEKTGKAIACKKPFILYGVKGSYEWLQKLGFKTFHPFINEDFDMLDDNNLRMEKIISEITRINNMSKEEILSLVKNCEEIVEYNYSILLEMKNHKWSEPFNNLDIFV